MDVSRERGKKRSFEEPSSAGAGEVYGSYTRKI